MTTTHHYTTIYTHIKVLNQGGWDREISPLSQGPLEGEEVGCCSHDQDPDQWRKTDR